MALLRISTKLSFAHKMALVRFVDEVNQCSPSDCVSIMTIEHDEFGGCSVSIVIDTSLADTETLNCLKPLLNIFAIKQIGISLKERENVKGNEND